MLPIVDPLKVDLFLYAKSVTESAVPWDMLGLFSYFIRILRNQNSEIRSAPFFEFHWFFNYPSLIGVLSIILDIWPFSRFFRFYLDRLTFIGLKKIFEVWFPKQNFTLNPMPLSEKCRKFTENQYYVVYNYRNLNLIG